MSDLEKVLTKNDKMELEKLEKWGDILNSLIRISDVGASLLELTLVAVLAYTMRFDNIPIVYKIVSGALIFYYPWIPWAIKCMSIPVNFTVSDLLLMSSGIALGARTISEIIEVFINKANRKAARIVAKYRSEEAYSEPSPKQRSE